MMNDSIYTTIILSLRIGLTATLLNIPPALFIADIMARKSFKGKELLDGFINLPLVIPPVTTGYILLLTFGKYGFIGRGIYNLTGLSIAFSQTAAIIASMVVSFPLIVRSLRISIEMVDPRLETAAMTLGAGKFETFKRVTIPLIFTGMVNGFIVGFARCLGEFGATITFAGNISRETRTLPLSVYSLQQIPGRERDAALLVVISIVISFTAMFTSSELNRRFNNWRSKK